MVDFSHMRIDVVGIVADQLKAGKKATDERYLDAIEQIVPPLLPEEMMAELRRELSPIISRRGRPRSAVPPLSQIADALRELQLPDEPQIVISGLVRRLETGGRYTKADRARAVHNCIERRKRGPVMRLLYDELTKYPGKGDCIDHPLWGQWVVVDQGSRSDKALMVVQDIMRQRFGYAPPSIRRMRNIISENRQAFRERRT